ncbi:hypothetical protein BO71DRAFT_89119 [Aspergillus ellipticus CBS 707.79]|uniref:Uncharacterized protein n=1 Tax=Aspergillus ellipticus CBS 707.79 TaxID=1448320 RepID=A0A319DKD1_9EURO|nr:hypothetical protein BO71DRAFT_89119 [Aspergillus ellipticus CBS 707.79]
MGFLISPRRPTPRWDRLSSVPEPYRKCRFFAASTTRPTSMSSTKNRDVGRYLEPLIIGCGKSFSRQDQSRGRQNALEMVMPKPLPPLVPQHRWIALAVGHVQTSSHHRLLEPPSWSNSAFPRLSLPQENRQDGGISSFFFTDFTRSLHQPEWTDYFRLPRLSAPAWAS